MHHNKIFALLASFLIVHTAFAAPKDDAPIAPIVQNFILGQTVYPQGKNSFQWTINLDWTPGEYGPSLIIPLQGDIGVSDNGQLGFAFPFFLEKDNKRLNLSIQSPYLYYEYTFYNSQKTGFALAAGTNLNLPSIGPGAHTPVSFVPYFVAYRDFEGKGALNLTTNFSVGENSDNPSKFQFDFTAVISGVIVLNDFTPILELLVGTSGGQFLAQLAPQIYANVSSNTALGFGLVIGLTPQTSDPISGEVMFSGGIQF